MKKCRFCTGEIHEKATRCMFCKQNLEESPDPIEASTSSSKFHYAKNTKGLQVGDIQKGVLPTKVGSRLTLGRVVAIIFLTAVWVPILGFTIYGIFFHKATETITDTSKINSNKEKFVLSLNQKIKGNHAWVLEVTEFSDHLVSAEVNYKSIPTGYAEVRNDTTIVAQKILESLMAIGKNPARELIYVSVYGQSAEKGVTGQNVIREFGNTSYDFSRDTLVWKPKLNN